MTRILITLIGLLVALPAICADEGIINIKGNFASMTCDENKNTYLLDQDNRLIKIKPDGEIKIIDLPKIMEAKPQDRFCDLAVKGNKIYLCGFAFPVVFELDLNKPEDYKIIKASDQEATRLNIINLSKKTGCLLIRDAEGYLFKLKNNQPLEKLPDYAAIESSPEGPIQVIPPPATPDEKNNEGSMTVLDENQNIIWKAPIPKSPRRVRSVEFLGTDKKNRNYYLVMTQSGELDSVFTIYAVDKGKIIAQQNIPTPINLEMQRFCVLSSDGTVTFAEPASETSINIRRISFAKN
ncbi:MAG: hypothetical protein PWR01_3682 [Clostridiales bacterium]|jgi:hypothetical protein|nr:hypothetical protein [Clostridiales bacterium]MDN5282609.1 hypothetical protein [Candidatus Ozemobacter sp.]